MNASGKGILYFFGFVVLCVVVVGVAGNAVAPKTIAPTDTSIRMVQPCGWFWCSDYDQQYAEHVNLPNSEANQNNGERILAEAEAAAKLKQAETERLRQRADYANSPAGAMSRVLSVWMFCGTVFVLGAIVLVKILK